MTDYTIRKLDDVPDAFGGEYPGAMRFLTEPLGNTQVAFTHRVMPPQTGGKAHMDTGTRPRRRSTT